MVKGPPWGRGLDGGRGCAESIVKGWAPRVGPRVCGSIVKGQPTGQRPPGIGVVSGLGAAGTIPELTVLYVLPYVLLYVVGCGQVNIPPHTQTHTDQVKGW